MVRGIVCVGRNVSITCTVRPCAALLRVNQSTAGRYCKNMALVDSRYCRVHTSKVPRSKGMVKVGVKP